MPSCRRPRYNCNCPSSSAASPAGADATTPCRSFSASAYRPRAMWALARRTRERSSVAERKSPSTASNWPELKARVASVGVLRAGVWPDEEVVTAITRATHTARSRCAVTTRSGGLPAPPRLSSESRQYIVSFPNP